jgi:hypothetical protein
MKVVIPSSDEALSLKLRGTSYITCTCGVQQPFCAYSRSRLVSIRDRLSGNGKFRGWR